MKQLSLRIAMVALCAMTVSVAVCRAQVDDPPDTTSTGSGAPGQGTSSGIPGQGTSGGSLGQDTSSGVPGQDTSGAASGQGRSNGVYGLDTSDTTSSKDDDEQLTAAPSGASKWTAGKTSFESPKAGWDNKSAGFGTSGAKSWTPGTDNFAERMQPGGIWREAAIPLPAVKRPAAESMQSATATTLLLTPRAHPGFSGARISRRARSRIARPKLGVPGASRSQSVPGSLHHGYGQGTDLSGSGAGYAAGAGAGSGDGTPPLPQ